MDYYILPIGLFIYSAFIMYLILRKFKSDVLE